MEETDTLNLLEAVGQPARLTIGVARLCQPVSRIEIGVKLGRKEAHLGEEPAGGPQPAAQDVFTADDKERQEAMVIVIAVEEPALLMAMDRIVGGIEVQNDLLWRLPMALP